MCSTTSEDAPPIAQRPWSELQNELVEIIAMKITTIADYIRFRVVCSPWRSATPAVPRHMPPQMPWLMLPNDACGANRRFFSLAGGVSGHRSLHLPETGGKQFCASSRGWLLVLEKSPEISLFNPLTRAVVRPPPLTTFPDLVGYRPSEVGEEYPMRLRFRKKRKTNSTAMRNLYLRKVVLSSDPALDGDCVVMVIPFHSWHLAFCRLGDESWKLINVGPGLYSVDDIICYRGQFYAIGSNGRFVVCDVGPSASFRFIHPGVQIDSDDDDLRISYHLVESARADLLLVVTCYFEGGFDGRSFSDCVVKRFRVFELELGGLLEKREIRSMGDSVLFLGKNDSICLRARGFSGCRRNHIYYTEALIAEPVAGFQDDKLICINICRYNLNNGGIEVVEWDLSKFSSDWAAPFWVTPQSLLATCLKQRTPVILLGIVCCGQSLSGISIGADLSIALSERGMER